MLLVDNPLHNPSGDFYFAKNSGQLANAPCAEMASKTFAGISRINPAMLEDSWLKAAYGKVYQAGEAFTLAPLLRLMIDKHKAKAAALKGDWVDVGTPQRLTDLNTRLLPSSPN